MSLFFVFFLFLGGIGLKHQNQLMQLNFNFNFNKLYNPKSVLLNSFFVLFVLFFCSWVVSVFFLIYSQSQLYNSSVMFRLLQIIGFVAFIFFHRTLVLTSASYCYSAPSSCANGLEITPPFWIDDGRFNCSGYSGFQIKCAVDGRPVINISNSLYYVTNLLPGKLVVMDMDIDRQECPQPRRNFSIASSRFFDKDIGCTSINIFYNCTFYPKFAMQHVPCLDDHVGDPNNSTLRSFAFFKHEITRYEFNWAEYCEEVVVVPTSFVQKPKNYTEVLKGGYELSWSQPVDCEDCMQSGGRCWDNKTTGVIHCKCRDGTTRVDKDCFGYYYDADPGLSASLRIISGVSAGIGAVQMILLIIYRKYVYALYYLTLSIWREKFKSLTNVEVFLESYYGRLSLKRYRFADIKKMTNSFKHTLGQGGYGSVFKGKLPDGQLVAVKVLNESKGKGEDFINEVATIGKTNHVNVVNLLGFCSEGTKRALIYEFMPNGSLARFIYTEKRPSTVSPLGLEKLYQIALGTAKGLDYLHYGCNTRILHFDIKPHNVLLDENFCPKIADFGLAKLCSTRESIVSLVDARGTMGYVAPEIYFRNGGGVSYKSDVYSYGKMVLEMIGGRMNSDATVENTSEIYFPHWIYKRLKRDIKVDGTDQIKVVVSGEIFEDDITQKMIIVALWCIQARPEDRPSMTKVVEMLEGSTEQLQMPPNPFPEAFSMSSSSSA